MNFQDFAQAHNDLVEAIESHSQSDIILNDGILQFAEHPTQINFNFVLSAKSHRAITKQTLSNCEARYINARKELDNELGISTALEIGGLSLGRFSSVRWNNPQKIATWG